MRTIITICIVLTSILNVSVSYAQTSQFLNWQNISRLTYNQWNNNDTITRPSRVVPKSNVEPAETIHVYSNDGNIFIHSPRRTQAKIYTILGQLVIQVIVGPGTSEIPVQPRGIYIVKVGSVTQKVAL